MLYYIILTQVCGLKCIYCMNEPNSRIMPIHLEIDIGKIRRFISRDPEPIICFYGGDPTMRLDLVTRIMDEVPAKHYVIQTNGVMLHRLHPEYIRRFDTILLSIDGRRETTDSYRGRGVYEKVIDRARYVRSVGFKGDLVARMTVSSSSDIYEEVTHLLSLNGLFTHVHWQLDVLWDYPPMQRYDDFDGWIERYNDGVSRLIQLWIREMEEGRVLGIAPFKGLMWSMLTGERTRYLRCGSGIDAYAIATDGRILACPIAPEFRFNVVGHIDRDGLDSIGGKALIGEPCLSCDYYDLCGGRCFFTNKTMFWGEEGFHKVCRTVFHLVDELRRVEPRIRELIDEGVIDMNMIKYPPYTNSVEIIP